MQIAEILTNRNTKEPHKPNNESKHSYEPIKSNSTTINSLIDEQQSLKFETEKTEKSNNPSLLHSDSKNSLLIPNWVLPLSKKYLKFDLSIINEPSNYKIRLMAYILSNLIILFLQICFLYLGWTQWKASLLTCNRDVITCLMIMQQKLGKLLNNLIFAGSIFTLMMISSCYMPNYVLGFTSMAMPCSTLAYLYFTSSGFDWKDHSSANFQIMVSFIVIFFVFFGVFRIFKNIYGRSKKFFGLAFTLLLLALSYFYLVVILKSCSHFDDSLHPDYKINETGNECGWKKSSICWHYVVQDVYWPIFWGQEDCSFETTDMSKYHTFLARFKKKNIVGLGNGHNLKYKELIYHDVLQLHILFDLRALDESQLEKDDREIYYDFRKDKVEGETLVKLRDLTKTKKYANSFKNHNNEYPNILNIFIDTISRQRFHRRFPKTRKFLEKYHYSLKKEKLVYEFFRLHSIRGFTWPNLMSQTYGNHFNVKKGPEMKRIEHYASDRGYVTGLAFDVCVGNPILRKGNETPIKIDRFPPHHLLIQPACDTNNLPFHNPFSFGLGRGPFTPRRNCFQKKDMLNPYVEYLKQFFDTYKEKRKMFNLRIIDGHELTGILAKLQIDPILAELLSYLDKKNHFSNTIVRIFSDHGDHINPICFQTASGKEERFNPFMFQMIPERLKNTVGKYLEINSQRLMSFQDFFVADLNVLGGFENPFPDFGVDYYQHEIKEERSCKDKNLGLVKVVDECFCIDKNSGDGEVQGGDV